jgi:hypothetical protein
MAMEWTEERSAGSRRWSCQRPSGYEASIVVAGTEVTARLWKAAECRDAFALPPLRLAAEEVEGTVQRVQAEIEARLDVIEDGHS